MSSTSSAPRHGTSIDRTSFGRHLRVWAFCALVLRCGSGLAAQAFYLNAKEILWLWLFPLFGALGLVLILLLQARRALLVGLAACGLVLAGFALAGRGEMSDWSTVRWLIGAAFIPWICFLVLLVSAVFGLLFQWRREKRQGDAGASRDEDARWTGRNSQT